MGKDSGLFVTVFADASYCPDTGAMGWAFWVKYGDPAKTIRNSGAATARTSTDAEVIALANAIQHIARGDSKVPLKDKVVVIQSDCVGALSKYDIGKLTKAGVMHVKKKHVKGHNGKKCPRSAVNSWCDQAARRAMREKRKELVEVP